MTTTATETIDTELAAFGRARRGPGATQSV
jgi:hypothetical protein